MINGNFEPLNWSVFKSMTFEKICTYYPPLFLGSVILGIVCAVIFYFLAFFITKKLNLKKKRVRRA